VPQTASPVAKRVGELVPGVRLELVQPRSAPLPRALRGTRAVWDLEGGGRLWVVVRQEGTSRLENSPITDVVIQPSTYTDAPPYPAFMSALARSCLSSGGLLGFEGEMMRTDPEKHRFTTRAFVAVTFGTVLITVFGVLALALGAPGSLFGRVQVLVMVPLFWLLWALMFVVFLRGRREIQRQKA